MSGPPETSDSPAAKPASDYVVIARRYRPQTFDDLIGQEHVGRALANAIDTGRVGHAYLFTGARGVGKTSAARILAKALNCENGPAPVPCNMCDSCLSIGGGDDVDVLEIDGASNRGIDEIRQLRQNVNVRPSRSRFKVYIIDEVHMLTREAFNALLKTLEEPPDHVKFVFCTTEPTKIPITILSRCQRFDFAGISTPAIVERLRQIVAAEGVEADAEALEALARRAAGSMRDSQSLLEQLLAFTSGRITVESVHGMLGSAGDERLTALLVHLAERRAAEALAQLDQAVSEGVDVAVLLEQLFGYFRDAMLAAADCPSETFLHVSPASQQEVDRVGKGLGLATVLAAMQILEHTLARMRYSTQGRILAELALVRICQLEDLDELGALVAELRRADPGTAPRGGPPAGRPMRPGRQASPGGTPAPQKKSPTARESGPSPRAGAPESQPAKPASEPAEPGSEGEPAATDEAAAEAVALSPDNAAQLWARALESMSGMVVDQARQFDRVECETSDRLVVTFKRRYALAKSACERPDQLSKFEKALRGVTGNAVRVEFRVEENGEETDGPASARARRRSPHQRMLEVIENPMVQRAVELFGAQPTRVEDPPGRP